MEENTKYGTLVTIHPAIQTTQVSMDTASWASR